LKNQRLTRDLRDRIICYLFVKNNGAAHAISESGQRVRELAKKFTVTPRTVCRILLVHLRAKKADVPR
jgi:hypothetical protein